MFPHPDNCAWYFNCSVRPDAVMEKYHGGHVLECPYPQLFSLRSGQCEDFEDVQCRGRYEPKSPCESSVCDCAWGGLIVGWVGGLVVGWMGGGTVP